MKIFICSSKHFYEKVPELKNQLEKMGHEVTFPAGFDIPYIEGELKKKSVENFIEFKKTMLREQEGNIRNNDAILVLNFEKKGRKNYIGGATFLEIYKAFELGKKVFLINPIPENIFTDELVGMNPVVLNGDLSRIG